MGHSFNFLLVISEEELREASNLLVLLLPQRVLNNNVEIL